jgi:hypothetical protein
MLDASRPLSFFSPRVKNSNARTLNRAAAGSSIEVIYELPKIP